MAGPPPFRMTRSLARRENYIVPRSLRSQVVWSGSVLERAARNILQTEHYERMRTRGDPRTPHRASDMPDDHREMSGAEIDRLARGEGYGDEP